MHVGFWFWLRHEKSQGMRKAMEQPGTCDAPPWKPDSKTRPEGGGTLAEALLETLRGAEAARGGCTETGQRMAGPAMAGRMETTPSLHDMLADYIEKCHLDIRAMRREISLLKARVSLLENQVVSKTSED